MGDITFCTGFNCPIANKCKRFILGRDNEKFGGWYMNNVPYKNNKCKLFYEYKN